MEFCGAEITSRFFLAPLAGYTDAGFRALVAENGAAVTYTEMVSAKGMCYGSPGTDALLYTTATESNNFSAANPNLCVVPPRTHASASLRSWT